MSPSVLTAFSSLKNGLYLPKGMATGSGPFTITNPSSPYTQFDMNFENTGGSVPVLDVYNKDVNGGFRVGSGGYLAITQLEKTRGTVAYGAHGKLPAFVNRIGGNVFYLTGHDYDRKLAGVRMYLNAAFVPASRPDHCNFQHQTPGPLFITESSKVTEEPSKVPVPSSDENDDGLSDDGGLAGWVIAIIVLFSISFTVNAVIVALFLVNKFKGDSTERMI